MRHKVIVYGLGRVFARHYAEIHERYDVVGYCDANFSKVDRFKHGISKAELRDCCQICDSILITLASGICVLRELVEMGVPVDKIKLFNSRENVLLSSKRQPALPQLIVHGKYHEDLALLLYCNRFKLNRHNLRYLEIGLEHIIQGSATYLLYGIGSKGRLVVYNYPACQDQAQIYRPKDEFFIIKSLRDIVINHAFDCCEEYDVIVLHGEGLTKAWLPTVYKIKPRILICCSPSKLMVLDIVSHGFSWGVSLDDGVSLYYASSLDERFGV